MVIYVADANGLWCDVIRKQLSLLSLHLVSFSQGWCYKNLSRRDFICVEFSSTKYHTPGNRKPLFLWLCPCHVVNTCFHCGDLGTIHCHN